MESKGCPGCKLPVLGGDLIKLLGSRGTIEILFIFCCTDKTMRFTEINNHMSHVSTKTLSTRLKQLNDMGILSRNAYNEIPPRVEYSITDIGQKLVDSLMPLINWVSENQRKYSKGY